jgi:general stress protein 26
LTPREPRRVRPRFPESWQVPNDPKLWITWTHANEKLEKEQVYWVSTATKAGRPHAAPVWGVWKDDRLYFETSPSSVKGKNLLSNPRIVVHLQDGMDAVIVEGTAARLKEKGRLDALKSDFTRKYDYTPDWSDETSQIVFEARPRVAHAWRAPRMHRTYVNFLF